MKAVVCLILVLMLVAGRVAIAESVVVSRVIDGDTFETADGRRIRVQGIDTPERKQAHGGDAWVLLNSWISGKQVDLRNQQPAAWSRTSAIVVYKRRDLGLELLRRGLAYVDERYVDPDVADAYRRGFQEGKQQKRGIWAVDVPPWEFRGDRPKGAAQVSETPVIRPVFPPAPLGPPVSSRGQVAQPVQRVIVHRPFVQPQRVIRSSTPPLLWQTPISQSMFRPGGT